MYGIEMTVDVSQIRELKGQVDRVQDFRMSALSSALSHSVVVIRDRIEKGKLSNGQMMQTKSAKKEGRYSKQWGKVRKKKGLRVDIVTLSFTGVTRANFALLNDFQAYKADSYNVGMKTDESDRIGGYNNDMFGPAYDYSEREVDDTFTDYLHLFNTELTNI